MKVDVAHAALTLQAVDKIYRSRRKPAVHAVKAMSMEVAPGEIVALLGSSGCGKTSTLRMIAGFEEVTNGQILIRDRPIHTLAPARRGVAMAFEGYSLYPPLTLGENIAFALKASNLSRAERSARVDAMAKLLEIGPILDRYPSQVSGGQQQRTSLGRALVREADLTLLDEPMGQLEPQLRALLRGRLKHFLREHRKTTIIVTHDQTEANALADRIAVMEDGELQQFATPQELKERPANLYVGTFIGEPPMNVFDAGVREAGGRIAFALADSGGAELSYPREALAGPVREAALHAGALAVGIRPHAVRLGDSGLPASVVSNQWLGDQSHLALEIGGRTVVAVVHRRLGVAVGETVHVAVAAGELHLFDRATGRAIAHGAKLAA